MIDCVAVDEDARGRSADGVRLMSALRCLVVSIVVVNVLAASHDAHAFCGFYVSGADAKLFADASQVVLMREGTRTVLSMQNDYQGPPESFAMVVPGCAVATKSGEPTWAMLSGVVALAAFVGWRRRSTGSQR